MTRIKVQYVVHVEHRRVGQDEKGVRHISTSTVRTLKAASELVEKMWEIHSKRQLPVRGDAGEYTTMASWQGGFHFITECSIKVKTGG